MNYFLLLILLILFIFVIFSYQFYLLYSTNNNNQTCKPCTIVKQEIIREPIIRQEVRQETPPPPPPPPVDPVRTYDYRKIYDPLEEPTRRVARYEIPRIGLKRVIDLPTRGYPDNFTQIGVLVKELDAQYDENNRILRLFGRQEYPTSNRYEYYTGINSGVDQIKVPLNTRGRRELYDGDTVYVKELDAKYRVQLHKYDAPRYYPDIF
jgi:hypothetical protein